jgi:tight adherence protein B
MEILTGIGLFIVILFLIELGFFALKNTWNPERKLIRKRLNSFSYSGDRNEAIDIRRKKVLSEVPWLNRMLSSFRCTKKMHRLLEQSGAQYPLGFFLLLSLLFVVVGFLVFSLATSNYLKLLPGAVFFGTMPFLYIYLKKGKRMQKFQRQLPDALDLVARSLKAGHAFSGGLKMVAEEFDNPVGVEFDKTMNEINLGVDVTEALKNLSNLVDCLDLNFFIISVIIQRETGGNLAEILENIARLIRERFKLHGRIRVLAAEGKLSAIILIALPFFVAFVISILNPEYIGTLITDPIGHILIAIAIIMMTLGIFIMIRMIKIKV